MLMSQKEFAEAKAVWTGISSEEGQPVRDLFGDEHDYMFRYLEREWVSSTVSKCQNAKCSDPLKESRNEHGGIYVG